MPTVHVANMLISLEKSSSTWSIPLQSGTDSRWSTQSTSYAWYFTLTAVQGADSVEFRVPTQIIDPDYGVFNITAKSTIVGQTSSTWSASSGYLCSAPFASGTQLYIEVEATPANEALPLTVPPSANPRGGGHVHVRTAGGGDPDGRRR
ncbi:hypothetical protein [Nannocystis pusilla]|uniref:hypothetical protein n=1 Tax=Nannocystis pusilla TaxID=889268 RepID=UPI003BF2F3EB